jgi:hypothetical protein
MNHCRWGHNIFPSYTSYFYPQKELLFFMLEITYEPMEWCFEVMGCYIHVTQFVLGDIMLSKLSVDCPVIMSDLKVHIYI